MLDRHLTIRSLAILACASVAHAQSERAYAALTELSTVNQQGFYVYKDLDSGENKGFPSKCPALFSLSKCPALFSFENRSGLIT